MSNSAISSSFPYVGALPSSVIEGALASTITWKAGENFFSMASPLLVLLLLLFVLLLVEGLGERLYGLGWAGVLRSAGLM